MAHPSTRSRRLLQSFHLTPLMTLSVAPDREEETDDIQMLIKKQAASAAHRWLRSPSQD